MPGMFAPLYSKTRAERTLSGTDLDNLLRVRVEEVRSPGALSDVQGEEPHGPSMCAFPGPGGRQAFLPRAPHTGRGGKRPGRVRDEDLDSLPVGRAQPGP